MISPSFQECPIRSLTSKWVAFRGSVPINAPASCDTATSELLEAGRLIVTNPVNFLEAPLWPVSSDEPLTLQGVGFLRIDG